MNKVRKTNFRAISAFCALLTAVLLLFAVVLSNFNQSIASADDTSCCNAAALNISLNTKGASGKATAKLEKETYTSGDEVVVKWSGAKVDNDFLLPTSITFNNKTYAMSQIIEVDKLQEINSTYKNAMGEIVTMTSYDSLLKYATKTHSFSLGKTTIGGNITVNFTRVSPVYRMYNKITSEHLFSTNKEEYDDYQILLAQGKDNWIGEGIAWLAPSAKATGISSKSTVKRLYNAGLGSMFRSSHYYTSDETEIKNLTENQGWAIDDSENWFVSGHTNGASSPIYTAYSELLGSSHLYTSSWSEWKGLDAGWNKEIDKNGLASDSKSATGVAKALLGTDWRFENNFYTVQHYLEGKLVDTQYVSGTAGEKTNAKASTYPGYTASTPTQATISNDDSTVVKINYSANKYNLTYDVNGGSGQNETKETIYGQKLVAPSKNPEKKAYKFIGWSTKKDSVDLVNLNTYTMPVGDLILYAAYSFVGEEISEQTTSVEGSFIYNGKSQTPTVAVADKTTGVELREGKDYAVSYKQGSKSVDAPTDAGSYTVVVTAIKGSNYIGSAEVRTFSIDKATIQSVTLKEASKTYTGSGIDAVIDSIATNSDAVPADSDCEITYKNSEGESVDKPKTVGSYKVVLSANEDSNFSGSTETDLTVTKATPIVTFTGEGESETNAVSLDQDAISETTGISNFISFDKDTSNSTSKFYPAYTVKVGDLTVEGTLTFTTGEGESFNIKTAQSAKAFGVTFTPTGDDKDNFEIVTGVGNTKTAPVIYVRVKGETAYFLASKSLIDNLDTETLAKVNAINDPTDRSNALLSAVKDAASKSENSSKVFVSAKDIKADVKTMHSEQDASKTYSDAGTTLARYKGYMDEKTDEVRLYTAYGSETTDWYDHLEEKDADKNKYVEFRII